MVMLLPVHNNLVKTFTRRLTGHCNFSINCNLTRPKMAWLDLRGTGLSALERLSIEELLLRHDPLQRCWGIVGVHEPTKNKVLRISIPTQNTQRLHRYADDDDEYCHEHHGSNNSCAIILGIGGKPERLIDINSAKRDGILVLKRFSGGGTVVVDHNSLWTTFIGRNNVKMSITSDYVKPFPRDIMEWSADTIFGPAFQIWNDEVAEKSEIESIGNKRTLVCHGTSCGMSGGRSEPISIYPRYQDTLQKSTKECSNFPLFQLKENDYVINEKKVGGNAQSIVSTGFLHHTSFLWDYDNSNMQYLSLPERRPNYRGNRSHEEFLSRLRHHYGRKSNKDSFFRHVKSAARETFDLENMSLIDVYKIANEKFGNLQQWFDINCRTKIIKLH